ncbi:MAG: hypothetical protein M1817_005133 [Caeruleum heppii]|nr:MAG: hypothetical protein M1817_005133 [Caeruleum heppii]
MLSLPILWLLSSAAVHSVTAAPAEDLSLVAREDWVRAYYPPQLDPVPCDIDRDACECSKNADGTFEYFCGYVDPDWGDQPRGKRSVIKEVRGASTGDAELPTAGLLRRDGVIQRREIIQRVAEPLFAAFATLGFEVARQGVQRVIRNRFPEQTRARFVTGIKGFLPKASTIGGIRFIKGAAWEIRYDFSWWQKGSNGENVMPPSGILGAHINMEVDDGLNRQTWAFYFKPDSFFYNPLGSMGDVYYSQIVKVLTAWAQYTSETFKFMIPEDQGARIIMEKWWDRWQQHQNGGELKRLS